MFELRSDIRDELETLIEEALCGRGGHRLRVARFHFSLPNFQIIKRRDRIEIRTAEDHPVRQIGWLVARDRFSMATVISNDGRIDRLGIDDPDVLRSLAPHRQALEAVIGLSAGEPGRIVQSLLTIFAPLIRECSNSANDDVEPDLGETAFLAAAVIVLTARRYLGQMLPMEPSFIGPETHNVVVEAPEKTETLAEIHRIPAAA